MLRDIIDYLASYLRGKIYTLLDKRCRHVYFSKYGLTIPCFRKVNNVDLLLRYKIFLDKTTRYEYYEFISIFHSFNESVREKILENLGHCTITILSTPSKILELLDVPIFAKNITKFNLRMSLNCHTVGTLEVDEVLNFKEIDTVMTIIFDNTVHIGDARLDKYVNIKCNKRWGNYSKAPLMCSELTAVSLWSEHVNYPEIKTILDKRIAPNIDIIAPKLEQIHCISFLDTYRLVTKYPTIKKISRVLDVAIEDFQNYMFVTAYNALCHYDFDLHFPNGVILPREYFDKLIKLELTVYNNAQKTGKSRIYRKLETLIDFIPTEKHWRLFDLDKVIQIS